MEPALPEILEFERPGESQPGGWEYALVEGFRFPERYLQKCKELAQVRSQHVEAQTRLDFAIRNLISIADNCEDAATANPEAADAPPTALAGVHRCVVNILENLGIVRVDLQGTNYENVRCQGRLVPDPFEVIETTQEGPLRTLPVLEVVRSLWVQPQKASVRVIRQGKVCC